MKVAVIMGSTSDLAKVEPAIEILKNHDVEVAVRVLSAHRAHDALKDFVDTLNHDGTDVIITAAGMAAALPGVVAAMTTLPVIGIPLSGAVLDGLDALLSIVQMPSGIPVATVAVNGSKNAAHLALEIMGIKYPELRERLNAERRQMHDDALKANADIIAKYEN